MVSVGLYRSAMNAAKEKTQEVKKQNSELTELKQRCNLLETQLKRGELSRKHEAVESEEENTVAHLCSELKNMTEKAQRESEKHNSTMEQFQALQDEIADMKIEMAMAGKSKLIPERPTVPKTISGSRDMLVNELKEPNQSSSPATPSVLRKENRYPNSSTTKQFLRSKGIKTARELRCRVHEMRSPRSALQTISMNRL